MGRVLSEFWYKFKKASLAAILVAVAVFILASLSGPEMVNSAGIAVFFGFFTFLGMVLR